MAQVSLNRLRGDEEALGDLAVGHPLGGETGDAELARGQRLDAAEDRLAGSGAGRRQLGAGALLQRGGATSVREVEPFTQGLAGLLAVVGSTQGGAKVDQSVGVLEPAPAPARISTASRNVSISSSAARAPLTRRAKPIPRRPPA